ncbi:MAG: hypothetical protein KC656_18600 [Myxococcales bacterium]|nr:hypothetical protein [Myxococcales bacterium]
MRPPLQGSAWWTPEVDRAWRGVVADHGAPVAASVYADVVQAAGSPVGELLSLLDDSTTPSLAQRERRAELYATHGHLALGELAGRVDPIAVVWRRGVPIQVTRIRRDPPGGAPPTLPWVRVDPAGWLSELTSADREWNVLGAYSDRAWLAADARGTWS